MDDCGRRRHIDGQGLRVRDRLALRASDFVRAASDQAENEDEKQR